MRVVFVNWKERSHILKQLERLQNRIEEAAAPWKGKPEEKKFKPLILRVNWAIDLARQTSFAKENDWNRIKAEMADIQVELNELLKKLYSGQKIAIKGGIEALVGPYILFALPRRFSQLLRSEIVEVVFSAVVLSLLVYPAYKTSFVGGFEDCLMVAGFGFTLDVGIGGVMSRIKTWLKI
jgi:hypothetical protein